MGVYLKAISLPTLNTERSNHIQLTGTLLPQYIYRSEGRYEPPITLFGNGTETGTLDMDGVLFNTMPTHARSWKQAADHYGLKAGGKRILPIRRYAWYRYHY